MMKVNVRLAGFLLIVFSLLGYVVCVEILYLSSNVRTYSLWLEDVPAELELAKEMVNETSEIFQRARFLLVTQELVNTTSELTQRLLAALTNRTIEETLDSTNRTLFKVVARLDVISNITRPKIGVEIRAAASSIRTMAENFSAFTLFTESSRRNMTRIVRHALKDLDFLGSYLEKTQTNLENWENYLNKTSTNIDLWISRTTIMSDNLRSIEYLLYVPVIYLVGLNTALLLTGIVLYKAEDRLS